MKILTKIQVSLSEIRDTYQEKSIKLLQNLYDTDPYASYTFTLDYAEHLKMLHSYVNSTILRAIHVILLDSPDLLFSEEDLEMFSRNKENLLLVKNGNVEVGTLELKNYALV